MLYDLFDRRRKIRIFELNVLLFEKKIVSNLSEVSEFFTKIVEKYSTCVYTVTKIKIIWSIDVIDIICLMRIRLAVLDVFFRN